MLDTSSLFKRAISGAIYVALIVVTFWVKSNIPFIVLFSFFAGGMLIEYNLLTKVNRLYPFRTTLDVVASVVLLVGTYMAATSPSGLWVMAFFFIYLFFVFGRTIFSDFKAGPIRSIGNVLVGHIYITLPLFFTTLAVTAFNLKREVLLVFIYLWINDTFAYLVGSLLGKHPLYKKISPKKSIEGLLGGFAGVVIAGAVVAFFADSYDVVMHLVFPLLVAILGTLGDLFESLIKRFAGVKDSGHIMPGHGGLLDRLDSFLFAIWALMLYVGYQFAFFLIP